MQLNKSVNNRQTDRQIWVNIYKIILLLIIIIIILLLIIIILGQLCLNDLPSDSGVSIGIGVAVSVLVVAVLAFLAIGRLKEKDQQYQELDTSKFVPQKT